METAFIKAFSTKIKKTTVELMGADFSILTECFETK